MLRHHDDDDDDDEHQDWAGFNPLDHVNNKPMFEHSLLEILINAEVLFLQGMELYQATVKIRYTNEHGEVGDNWHDNVLLNSIICDLEFLDGTVREYVTNIIA